MALFGPWMTNWWLKKLEKGGVALIKALDHHKHRLLIIYKLDQGTTSFSRVYKWVSIWALGGLLTMEPGSKNTRHTKVVSQVLLVI